MFYLIHLCQVNLTFYLLAAVTVVVVHTTLQTTLMAESLTDSANLPKSFLGTMTAERGLTVLLASAIDRYLNVTA